MAEIVRVFLSRKLLHTSGWRGVDMWTYTHWCPACNEPHDYAVETPFWNGARWSWDGNVEAPSFQPSMSIKIGPFPDGHIERCHYYLTAGKLIYTGDCTHSLKGQTVPLPDYPVK